jgi:hypothetical protein
MKTDIEYAAPSPNDLKIEATISGVDIHGDLHNALRVRMRAGKLLQHIEQLRAMLPEE